MNAPPLSRTVTGRFAPSPTGRLHAGSLVAAIGSYLYAKAVGGRWLLRMEDLDTPRVVPGAAAAIERDLEQLGLHWDGSVLYQSTRVEAYAAALDTLDARGLSYPCGCSRREIEKAGGVYPGICRAGLPPGRVARALRFRVPPGAVRFTDLRHGGQIQWPERQGDFILRRADGFYAYLLACVVDDAFQGINQVVRGADLLDITGRQRLLQDALRYPEPVYAHLPLVLNPDGSKLSKSAGADAWQGDPARAWRFALRQLGVDLPAALGRAPAKEIRAYALHAEGLSAVAERAASRMK